MPQWLRLVVVVVVVVVERVSRVVVKSEAPISCIPKSQSVNLQIHCVIAREQKRLDQEHDIPTGSDTSPNKQGALLQPLVPHYGGGRGGGGTIAPDAQVRHPSRRHGYGARARERERESERERGRVMMMMGMGMGMVMGMVMVMMMMIPR